jgi:hypothetical protein
MLIADLGRRSFEMDLNPSRPLRGARGFLQTRIHGRVARNQRQRRGQNQHEGQGKGGASHLAIIVGAMEDTTQLRKLTAHVKAAG